MTRIHTDLSRVPISVAPSPATSGTSLGVTDANAAYLPDTYPYWAVLVPTGAAPTRSNSEVVKVTGGSSSGGTTTLTIVRAQGIPVTTAQTVTTSFDIYDANSAEALPQVSSEITETPSGTMNSSNTTFTLSQTPTSGTVKLYHNRTRLKLTDDYTISGATITLVSAPVSGDSLIADYSIVSGTFSTGSASFVSNEVPSGTINSSNQTFTLANTPVAGTLRIERDGQSIYETNDWTLSGTTLTMVEAPVTGSVLRAFYQQSVSTAGNADLLDGYHANATPTASNIPVLDANAKLPNSILAAEAWSSWNPTSTGITVGNGSIAAYYKQIGKIVTFSYRFTFGSTSSITGNINVTVPVGESSNASYTPVGVMIQDSGTGYLIGQGVIISGAFWIYATNTGSSYGSGSSFSSTVPITWATGDTLTISGTYEAA